MSKKGCTYAPILPDLTIVRVGPVGYLLHHSLFNYFTSCMSYIFNSAAKFIVGDKRKSLNHEIIDKLDVLRLDRDFMVYFRQHGSMARVQDVNNSQGNDVDMNVI